MWLHSCWWHETVINLVYLSDPNKLCTPEHIQLDKSLFQAQSLKVIWITMKAGTGPYISPPWNFSPSLNLLKPWITMFLFNIFLKNVSTFVWGNVLNDSMHACMLSHVQLLKTYGLYSPPSSSVDGVFQARVGESVAIPSSGALLTQRLTPGLLPLLQSWVGSLPLSPEWFIDTNICNPYNNLEILV